MGTKSKVAKKKTAAEKGPSEKAAPKKTRRQYNKLSRMSLGDLNQFFEEATPEQLIQILNQSYAGDIVNLWMDVKNSVVRDLLRRTVNKKKSLLLPAITLYQYKQYLTNPLPLVLDAVDGGEIPNYYAIVGLDRDSSDAEVKEARRLLRQAHAQTHYCRAEQATARQRLEEINDAFSLLADSEKRRLVDHRLPSIHYLYPRRDQSWLTAFRTIVDR